MIRAALLAVALLLPAFAVQAQEPREVADRLMRSFVDQGAETFLERVLADTAMGGNATARRQIHETRARWLREIEGLGAVADFVYAGERHHGPVFRSLCYVVRYRRAPLFFHFRFYQTPRQWELVQYAWNETFANWDCANAAPVIPPPSSATVAGDQR